MDETQQMIMFIWFRYEKHVRDIRSVINVLHVIYSDSSMPYSPVEHIRHIFLSDLRAGFSLGLYIQSVQQGKANTAFSHIPKPNIINVLEWLPIQNRKKNRARVWNYTSVQDAFNIMTRSASAFQPVEDNWLASFLFVTMMILNCPRADIISAQQKSKLSWFLFFPDITFLVYQKQQRDTLLSVMTNILCLSPLLNISPLKILLFWWLQSARSTL